jgi:serine/threonine-protein kinase
VESATRACELTEWKDPASLDILAAANAEARGFDAAVKWQEKAIELVNDDKVMADYPSRLALYRDKKPYRQTGKPE